jgi:hypothetical protein
MQMFVNRVVTDKWIDVYCDEEEIETPSLADIDLVIDALDAKVRTFISLYGQDGTFLAIGGGSGQYVVYASICNEQLWNLLSDKDVGKDIILLNAGGQEGDFPARQVVNKLQALQAAHTFALTGQLDSNLLWEKQT